MEKIYHMSIESEKTSTAWPCLDQAQPRTEAKSLAMLVRNGESVESVRQLIDVSDKDMFLLEAMIREKPELTGRVQSSLSYRARVRQEFDRIIAKQL